MALIFLLFVSIAAGAFEPAKLAPNSHDLYKQLRNLTLGTEAVTLSNFQLKRDAGVFTLTGTVCFAQPINGKVTGAVFTGTGTFSMTPPTQGERKSLSYLTKEPRIVEQFGELALRFSDETYAEMKKAGTAATGSCSTDFWPDAANIFRKKLNDNISGRLLQDVMAPTSTNMFVALIRGKKYNGKLLYKVDPKGSMDAEEVMLMTYDEAKWGTWSSFHLEAEHKNNTARSDERDVWIDIEDRKTEVTLEKSGRVAARAETTFVVEHDGLVVVPFDLYRTLRVESVTLNGKPLHFIQEDKDDDPDFFVILPEPARKGAKLTVTMYYGGKDVLWHEGGGNYYLVGGARSRWYPSAGFKDYASYTMKFTYPKDLQLVASGRLLSEKREGDVNISEWTSDGPQTVAAFQMGRYKKEQKQLTNVAGSPFDLETYANQEVPAAIRSLQTAISMAGNNAGQLGATNFSTTGMARKAMGEAQLSVLLFTDYFGNTPFKRLAITQQTAMDYGQSWPGLIWLPMSYFYDSTTRHNIGFDDPTGYFKVVGPHEIAHQWFGHTVTWASYRDQWMSEGFSDLAASLFIQVIQQNNGEFIKFWNDEKRLITERNKEGFRAIDVGPLTMGYRLNNSKVGDITRRLIYPKGAYVLHMIRMMMWSPKTQDDVFKGMMRDFHKTYYQKPVTTEDFKRTVEKFMTPGMDLTGNGRMDWFFDAYVYGTALPDYKMQYTTEGNTMKVTVTQSNVDETFQMLVPIYAEWKNGKTTRLGMLPMTGNSTRDTSIPFGGELPKRLIVNYFNDVLCTIEGK